ncbi:flavin reductase family protein [Streptomyces tsukubensis]|nr:flavin reductase family protein [Streptomyces tsukubensis]
MSQWASGVAVVTTTGQDRRSYGFTASSFTVVSLEPATVLVCLDRTAECAPAFGRSQWLAVSILGAGQREVARRFARKGHDKFAETDIEPGRFGAPLVSGAIGTLECRTVRHLPVGDHMVLIAEVHAAGPCESAVASGEGPLVYHRRAFHALGLDVRAS